MYVCQSCKQLQPPRTPSHLHVVETRPQTYIHFDIGGERRESFGHEIVREIRVCPPCLKELSA